MRRHHHENKTWVCIVVVDLSPFSEESLEIRAGERESMFDFFSPRDPRKQQAEEICYEAMEYMYDSDKQDAVREALSIDPDCVMAFNLKGNCYLFSKEVINQDPSKALDEYEKGIAAGLRENPNRRTEAHWGLDDRAYMRALWGKCMALEKLNRLAEALAVAKHMLQLNPGDNQGMRGIAVNQMLLLGQVSEAAQLLQRYVEDAGSVDVLYPYVLIGFMQCERGLISPGDVIKRLQTAMQSNIWVPQCLLRPDQKPADFDPEDGFSCGFASEAWSYVQHSLDTWARVPGALHWLREMQATAELPSRDELVRVLKRTFLLVQFIKVEDGSLREMHCTKCVDKMPQSNRPQSQQPDEDAVRAYERKRDGFGDWRSFRYDSIVALPFYRVLAAPD
jgi:tetratricopeptide (TPR) repeat protein